MNLPWIPALPKQLVKGFLTHAPALRNRVGLSGILAPVSARYCYSVWLRHVVVAHERTLTFPFDVVAELGPGPSLGIGLAALLTGTRQYFAFDVEAYTQQDQNLRTFEELVRLLQDREPIPDEREFPEVVPRLKGYAFPRQIFTDELLRQTLDLERCKSITRILTGEPGDQNSSDLHLSYIAPWDDPARVHPDSVDIIISQAVLEHVDDLEKTYQAMNRWLKPGGLLSHAIDFRSHGTANPWNGHWAYSDFIWKLIRGNRAYYLNRQPYSAHQQFLHKNGFTLTHETRYHQSKIEGLNRKKLAARFAELSDDDLTTSAVFIQAQKRYPS